MRPMFGIHYFHNDMFTADAVNVEGTQFGYLDYGDPCLVPDLQATATGAAEGEIVLRGLSPTNQVSITGSLNGFLNLSGFDRDGAATANVTATSTAQVSTVNGVSQGTETAAITADVSIYLPTDHAIVDVQLHDQLSLNLKASGFLGGGTAATSASQKVLVEAGPTTPGGPLTCTSPFDLGSFVASIINQAQYGINAANLSAGEMFNISGRSVLNVDAKVEFLKDGLGSAVVAGSCYDQTDVLTIAYGNSGCR